MAPGKLHINLNYSEIEIEPYLGHVYESQLLTLIRDAQCKVQARIKIERATLEDYLKSVPDFYEFQMLNVMNNNNQVILLNETNSDGIFKITINLTNANGNLSQQCLPGEMIAELYNIDNAVKTKSIIIIIEFGEQDNALLKHISGVDSRDGCGHDH